MDLVSWLNLDQGSVSVLLYLTVLLYMQNKVVDCINIIRIIFVIYRLFY